MGYCRVIPRDLFNEAKLLKCMGRLSLLIHDQDIRLSGILNINHEDERSGFKIEQNEDDGSIYVSNLHVFDNNGTNIYLSTALNGRSNYPLLFTYDCGFGEKHDFVFDDNGDFTREFLDAIKQRF